MRISHKSALISLSLVLCLAAGSAYAQATRTWVSGVGDDVNPCSRTAPCKTFAGAISKTAVGGEIDALDSAGYGAVTITKSITIEGTGFLASCLHSGTNGMVINLTTNDSGNNTVILRDLEINGGNTGLSGVKLLSSVPTSLHIEHCDIQRATTGIELVPSAGGNGSKIYIKDTDVRLMTTDGIRSNPGAGATIFVMMNHVRSQENFQAGYRSQIATGSTLDFCNFQGNTTGVQIDSSTSKLRIAHTAISENAGNGLNNGGTATTFLDDCAIFGNGTGILNNTGGVVNGFGNNAIANNTSFDVNGAAVVTLAHP
jgi:hypothetical protein